MKIIFILIIALVVAFQVNKILKNSDQDLIDLIKNVTIQRIIILISIIWFIFAIAMIEPFQRVDAWDSVLIIAVLPVVFVNGLLWILKNDK